MNNAELVMPKSAISQIDVNIDIATHIFETAKVPVYAPYPLYDCQKQMVSYLIQCLHNSQHALVQSPTGTGKTLSLLCSTLSWARTEQQLGRPAPRIIYTSRTHAQLAQVVHQLIKSGFMVKLSVLGSRDHTCINEDLSQLGGKSKELECRLRVMRMGGLLCRYFHHEEYYLKMKNIGKIADLEEIKAIGKSESFCPYFYEKHCKNKANLILMPYTYLLDEKSSEDIGSLLQNSVVIFDEGHNIPNACESSKQFSINLNTLSRALQHLGTLREHQLSQHNRKTPHQIEEEAPEKGKATSIHQLQMHASFVSLIHGHMQTLKIPPEETCLAMNAHDFLQSLDSGTEGGQFGKLRNNIKLLSESSEKLKSDIILKPYWALESWIGFLHRLREMYSLANGQTPALYLKCQIAYNGSDIQLNIFCLDPKIGFHRITAMNPRCIILTSGTLSPLNSIPLELETQFAKPLACPSLVRQEQVNGCILTRGPNKVRLNFCYENRDNATLYKQLGLTLLEITSKTPNGVIVFVPSYAVLDKLKQELTNCGVMAKLYSLKSIFFEKQNSADFRATLDKYLVQATKTKGALLLALARGKISEGLDFANEKCRAVVMVGLPYLAAKDLKVTSKMQYLDSKSRTAKSMNGNQWYVCEAIRCINQSIGRIIRNKEDYGSIYLIDERFKKQEILSQISSWAKDSLKTIDDFQEFKLRIEIFQDYFSSKHNPKSDQPTTQLFFTSNAGTKLTNQIKTTLKTHKHSVSLHHQSLPQTQTVDPEKEFELLRTQLTDTFKPQQPQQPKSQQTRQRIIFTNKQTKKLPSFDIKECPVCRMERGLIKNTQCIHEICEQCWDTWLKTDLRCPICRVRVREKYLLKR